VLSSEYPGYRAIRNQGCANVRDCCGRRRFPMYCRFITELIQDSHRRHQQTTHPWKIVVFQTVSVNQVLLKALKPHSVYSFLYGTIGHVRKLKWSPLSPDIRTRIGWVIFWPLMQVRHSTIAPPHFDGSRDSASLDKCHLTGYIWTYRTGGFNPAPLGILFTLLVDELRVEKVPFGTNDNVRVRREPPLLFWPHKRLVNS
jgi:hypothetical protein